MTEMQATDLLLRMVQVQQVLGVLEHGMRLLVFTGALIAGGVFGLLVHRWVRGR